MSAVLGSLMSGDIFGAIKSLVDESPQENIREAAVDILDGKDVNANLQKLAGELERSGGDREKMAQVEALMQDLASGRADQTSTMERILMIVGEKDAQKRGITPTSVAGKDSSCVEF